MYLTLIIEIIYKWYWLIYVIERKLCFITNHIKGGPSLLDISITKQRPAAYNINMYKFTEKISIWTFICGLTSLQSIILIQAQNNMWTCMNKYKNHIQSIQFNVLARVEWLNHINWNNPVFNLQWQYIIICLTITKCDIWNFGINLLWMMISKVYDILWYLIQKLLKKLNIHNETLQLQRNIMTISQNIYIYIYIHIQYIYLEKMIIEIPVTVIVNSNLR